MTIPKARLFVNRKMLFFVITNKLFEIIISNFFVESFMECEFAADRGPLLVVVQVLLAEVDLPRQGG